MEAKGGVLIPLLVDYPFWVVIPPSLNTLTFSLNPSSSGLPILGPGTIIYTSWGYES